MSELFSPAVSVQKAECFQRLQAAVSSGSYSGCLCPWEGEGMDDSRWWWSSLCFVFMRMCYGCEFFCFNHAGPLGSCDVKTIFLEGSHFCQPASRTPFTPFVRQGILIASLGPAA